MMQSVVSSRQATEEAFSSAVRSTLAGVMMPRSIMSQYSSFRASKPRLPFSASTLLTMTEPFSPALSAMV